MRSISPKALKHMLAQTSEEVAILDIREFGEYGMGHPFHAVNAPFSQLEAIITRLVPRHSVQVVVMDDHDEGRARRSSQRLSELGYHRVAWMEGGVAAWQAMGYGIFAGVNVVSKTFGELVQEHYHTPGLDASILADWQQQQKNVHVIDGRTIPEYKKMNIPGSACCPNGELAKRLPAMLEGDTTTPVVINCAGRTRSIIGAQTLRWLGIQNPVFALENGTQGWQLAGLQLENSSTRHYPDEVSPDATWAADARSLAEKHGVSGIDATTLNAWMSSDQRTTYVFDVRTVEEWQHASPRGAIHAPGGQLIQATDHWVGVYRARLVLIDDDECRAPVVATWLTLMGMEVAWLRGGASGWGDLNCLAQRAASAPALSPLPLCDLKTALAPTTLCLDVRPGMQFRKGHLPGVLWVNRSLLETQLANVDVCCPIVIIGDEGRSACLAADLAVLGISPPSRLPPDTAAWEDASVILEHTPHYPDDDSCIDFLFFVHDRHDGNLEASRRYLAWETGLLAQLDSEERKTFAI